ncbi:MAG: YdeI/OmpD-associated family protein, partial [Bacteroidia bacterium]
DKTNVLILGGFKEYCVLSFLKGVLLKDEHKKLVKPGENSQSVRFFKFKSAQEIIQEKDLIKAYLFEAIELEKSGAKVDKTESKEFELPEELLIKFKENPALKKAFEALTIGRQRAYIIHFTGSKQSKTIQARIEKYIPRILSGKGFNDCVCGLSKRMPNCDGSHKTLQGGY